MYPPAPDPSATRTSLFVRLRSDGTRKEFAWREFYDRYAPIIGGFCRKMGAQSHEIPDVVQDVMLGFFAVTPTFEYDPGKGRFRGYLKTCTWRALQRRAGNDLQISGRSLDKVDPADIAVETAWADVWESEKLREALELVRIRYLARPDKARTFRAFEMYVLLDRSAESVAGELQITIGSVHQAKSRISKALKAALLEIEEQPD